MLGAVVVYVIDRHDIIVYMFAVVTVVPVMIQDQLAQTIFRSLATIQPVEVLFPVTVSAEDLECGRKSCIFDRLVEAVGVPYYFPVCRPVIVDVINNERIFVNVPAPVAAMTVVVENFLLCLTCVALYINSGLFSVVS